MADDDNVTPLRPGTQVGPEQADDGPAPTLEELLASSFLVWETEDFIRLRARSDMTRTDLAHMLGHLVESLHQPEE